MSKLYPIKCIKFKGYFILIYTKMYLILLNCVEAVNSDYSYIIIYPLWCSSATNRLKNRRYAGSITLGMDVCICKNNFRFPPSVWM